MEIRKSLNILKEEINDLFKDNLIKKPTQDNLIVYFDTFKKDITQKKCKT